MNKFMCSVEIFSFCCRYYPALKTLEQLEHMYLPRVANYRFSHQMKENIPRYAVLLLNDDDDDDVFFCFFFFFVHMDTPVVK